MQCDSCNAHIPPTMRGAIRTNTCPYCAGNIMEEVKSEQYNNLLEVLENTTFTNRGDVDLKIREKVANLIVTNFIFMRVESQDQNDIIVVQDQPEVVQESVSEVVQQVPVKAKKKKTKRKTKLQKTTKTGKQINKITEDDLDKLDELTIDQAVRSMPSTNKIPSPKKNIKAGGGLTMSDYIGAQEDIYTERPQQAPQAQPQMSAEEVMRMFPGMSPEEALEAVRQDTSLLDQLESPTQTGLTGKGIKRL